MTYEPPKRPMRKRTPSDTTPYTTGYPKRQRTIATRARMRMAKVEQNPLTGYYTVQRAAEILQTNPSAITRAIRNYQNGQHGIRATKQAGRWFIHHRELERWAHARKPYHPPREIPIKEEDES